MRKNTRSKKKTVKRRVYSGPERRKFVRLSYKAPLMYKICKKKTFSKLMYGYTHDISQAGLMCTLSQEVPVKAIIWLRLDIGALNACREIEKQCTVIQQGILGKVVWTKKKRDDTYDIGVQFVTREERRSEDWILKKP
jgi:c-di-GMP-binding flagellar brake protein YcgR